MLIHPVNDNPHEYTVQNYQTLCQFCHDARNSGMKGDQPLGQFIYLPGVSQARLNWLFYAITISNTASFSSSGAQFKTQALALYKELRDMSDILEREWGRLASTPQVVSSLLIEFPESSYTKRHTLFYGFRFLPDLNNQYSNASRWHDTEFINADGTRMERNGFTDIYNAWKGAKN